MSEFACRVMLTKSKGFKFHSHVFQVMFCMSEFARRVMLTKSKGFKFHSHVFQVLFCMSALSCLVMIKDGMQPPATMSFS